MNSFSFFRQTFKTGNETFSSINSNLSLDKIFKIYNTCYEGFKKFKDTSDLVIIFGKTGDGKSTLINHLNDISLKKVTKNGSTVYEADEAMSVSKIGHGNESMTITPKLVKKYLDLPGSMDSRGKEHEIAVGISIKAIIQNSSSIKSIIAVISESSFKLEKSIFLKKFVQDLSFFHDNIAVLAKSLIFVITKCNFKNPMGKPYDPKKGILTNIQKLKEELTEDLKKKTNDYTQSEAINKQIQLLDVMLETPNFICINYEDKDGSKAEIQSMISQCKAIPGSSFKFQNDENLQIFEECLNNLMRNGIELKDVISDYPKRIEMKKLNLQNTEGEIEAIMKQIKAIQLDEWKEYSKHLIEEANREIKDQKAMISVYEADLKANQTWLNSTMQNKEILISSNPVDICLKNFAEIIASWFKFPTKKLSFRHSAPISRIELDPKENFGNLIQSEDKKSFTVEFMLKTGEEARGTVGIYSKDLDQENTKQAMSLKEKQIDYFRLGAEDCRGRIKELEGKITNTFAMNQEFEKSKKQETKIFEQNLEKAKLFKAKVEEELQNLQVILQFQEKEIEKFQIYAEIILKTFEILHLDNETYRVFSKYYKDSSKKSLSEIIDLFQDAVTCERMRNPVTLNCGHTFDESTLKKLNNKRCPLCNSEFKVDQIKVNITMKSMIESTPY